MTRVIFRFSFILSILIESLVLANFGNKSSFLQILINVMCSLTFAKRHLTFSNVLTFLQPRFAHASV